MFRQIITLYPYANTLCCTRGTKNISSGQTPLTLYGDEVSPPVRFVLMTASLLGVPLKFHKVELFKGENRLDSYKKINPLQKVPALTVGDSLTIADSHAIALYLCESTKHQTLYPDDPAIRPVVQQMLFFNSSTLFPPDSALFGEYFAQKGLSDKNLNSWQRALDYLEYKLCQHTWLAGEKMTICDICCGATVSSVGTLVPLTEKHAKVNKWMEKLRELPCNVINERGLEKIRKYITLFKNTT